MMVLYWVSVRFRVRIRIRIRVRVRKGLGTVLYLSFSDLSNGAISRLLL